MTEPRRAEVHDVLSRTELRRAAGARSFARGEDYAAEGRVRGAREQGGMILATVCGSDDYRVSLGILGGQLASSCTCPVGREGSACKHVVAVGLTWLDHDRPRSPSEDDIRGHLLSRTKEELVDLIMARAAEDEWLHGRVMLGAASAQGAEPDLPALAAAFDAAIETGGFVPYREAYDYFRVVDMAIEEIAALLGEHPAAAMDLAEHGLAALEEVLGSVDDSDGGLTIAVSRLSDLHLSACTACSADPETLAERLFRAELASELEVFHGAAATYADILGPAGLARYRRLAEAEWSRLPALGPGESGRLESRRFRVTAMMEALARADGDIDALVEVMAHDLSFPYGYVRIAEVLQEGGRAEEALAWAERGLRAFPERHDSRLSDLVANAYLRAGRHEEAMSLTWEDFAARPVLERYERLRERASAAGTAGAWGERARAHLRAHLAAARVRTRGHSDRWHAPSDASELVRILLADDDIETAWAEARAGGASGGLWLRLAELREEDHPEDALDVYRRGIEPAVARTNRGGYEEAIALLKRMRPLMHRLDRQAPFGQEVADLRSTHRRKRNLVRLLDALGWPEVPGSST